MTIFFVSSVCFLPSSDVTSTLPGAVMQPVPINASTLFFLNRNATPLTLAATVSALCFIIAAKSSFGAPVTTPSAGKLCAASSNISEA